MSKVMSVAKKVDPLGQFILKHDNQRFKDFTNMLGMTQTDAVKREQRDLEAKATASADAAVQASKNLSINSLVDLGSADNAPDVVAGGTADVLGMGSGVKRKKSGLSSQLGIQV